MNQQSMVSLQALIDGISSATNTTILSLTKRQLTEEDFTEDTRLPTNLVELDLSRNSLTNLPPQITQLTNLIRLNISRNSLRSLPSGIQNLKQLEELNALSNQFRLRLLPLPELATLPALRVLDLRYNGKLKQHAQNAIEEAFATRNVEVRCTRTVVSTPQKEKLPACDRDPTVLKSQLEPLSTPQLRKRLERTFGIVLDDEEEEAYDRNAILRHLLDEYDKMGPREIRKERGTLLSEETIQELLQEMQAIQWPQTTRERPKIKAEYYMILQKPGSGQPDSKRTRLETAKLTKYRRIFDAAVRALKVVDPAYADRFTALAVTRNFMGSPHIDTLNVGPFYGLSLGDFTEGGGKIAVECSPTLVAEIDTRNRLGKVDGRFPHWVTPYEGGTRYSLIYYVTSGPVEPQTTAIFAPQGGAGVDWVPPPSFVP